MILRNYTGLRAPSSYANPGNPEQEGLSATLSMISGNTLESCHDAVADLRIENGRRIIPPSGIELAFNGVEIIVAGATVKRESIALPKSDEVIVNESIQHIVQTVSQDSSATLALVHSDKDLVRPDQYIMVAGFTGDADEPDNFLVGDSHKDGVQLVETDHLRSRLLRSVQSIGSILLWQARRRTIHQ